MTYHSLVEDFCNIMSPLGRHQPPVPITDESHNFCHSVEGFILAFFTLGLSYSVTFVSFSLSGGFLDVLYVLVRYCFHCMHSVLAFLPVWVTLLLLFHCYCTLITSSFYFPNFLLIIQHVLTHCSSLRTRHLEKKIKWIKQITQVKMTLSEPLV